MIELFPVPQLRLTFDDALTPVLVRVARKKAGVGMAMLFSLMLVAPMEPNDPVPVQAMDAAEMAPLTAICEAPTGPKLPVPVDDILAQVTAPLAEIADVEMPFKKVPVPSNVAGPEQYKLVKLPVPPVKLVPLKVAVGPVGPGTELANPSRPVGPVWPVGPATVLADPSRPVGPVWPLVAAAAAAEAAAATAAATATATAAD